MRMSKSKLKKEYFVSNPLVFFFKKRIRLYLLFLKFKKRKKEKKIRIQ